MASNTQTLKSALDSRVRIDQSHKLGSQRQNLGEGLMCPASAGDIQNDVYGRPVSQNTLRLTDSACSNYTQFSAGRRIEVENLERPYLPVCAAGLRGAADWMGKGRDILPQNLYGSGYQGNMIRHYAMNPANMPPDQTPAAPMRGYYQKKIQPFSYSMDGTSFQFRG
jgi:hypothetical protein